MEFKSTSLKELVKIVAGIIEQTITTFPTVLAHIIADYVVGVPTLDQLWDYKDIATEQIGVKANYLQQLLDLDLIAEIQLERQFLDRNNLIGGKNLTLFRVGVEYHWQIKIICKKKKYKYLHFDLKPNIVYRINHSTWQPSTLHSVLFKKMSGAYQNIQTHVYYCFLKTPTHHQLKLFRI